MTPDLINGLFEFCGALMLAKNVHQLYKDKLVRGVHWMPTMFFAAWGLWNLFYYPHLEQMWSFAGGIAIVSVNLAWFGLMVYYKERERRCIQLVWRLPGESAYSFIARYREALERNKS
jgi:hypothetical protein